MIFGFDILVYFSVFSLSPYLCTASDRITKNYPQNLFAKTRRAFKNQKRHCGTAMFLAENLKTLLSASIAFDRSNAKWAKPKPIYVNPQSSCFASGNPYTNRKSKHARKILHVCSFSVRFSLELWGSLSLTVMNLLRKRYDMIAHQTLNLAKPIITIRSIS